MLRRKLHLAGIICFGYCFHQVLSPPFSLSVIVRHSLRTRLVGRITLLYVIAAREVKSGNGWFTWREGVPVAAKTPADIGAGMVAGELMLAQRTIYAMIDGAELESGFAGAGNSKRSNRTAGAD